MSLLSVSTKLREGAALVSIQGELDLATALELDAALQPRRAAQIRS